MQWPALPEDKPYPRVGARRKRKPYVLVHICPENSSVSEPGFKEGAGHVSKATMLLFLLRSGRFS